MIRKAKEYGKRVARTTRAKAEKSDLGAYKAKKTGASPKAWAAKKATSLDSWATKKAPKAAKKPAKAAKTKAGAKGLKKKAR